MSGVDALIVTALQEEYEAVADAAITGYAGNPGVDRWEVRDGHTRMPYLIGRYVMADGSQMSAALARPTRAGSVHIAQLATALMERLSPRCLAMCGVCAGNPASTAPGDVIVAEMAYMYDEGKRTEGEFEADHRQVPMPVDWIRTAQDMSPLDLPSHGAASDEDSKLWLLERLFSGVDPRRHPARSRYIADDAWRERLDALQACGLLVRAGADLELTEPGRTYVKRAIYEDVRDRRTLPFGILVGPMASGNAVVSDGRAWQQLRTWGVRTILGLEMEAAAIAAISHRMGAPAWAVVKGVMDHADLAKDDRYKSFAARASAEVLWKLLALQLATTADSGGGVRAAAPRAPRQPSGHPTGRSAPRSANVRMPSAERHTAEPTLTIASRPGTVPIGLDAANGILVVADDTGISSWQLRSHAILWQWRTRWRSVACGTGSSLIANGIAQMLTIIDRDNLGHRLDVATTVPISKVALSPDGMLVAVGAAVPLGGGRAEIELRRTHDGVIVHRLGGLTATIRDLTFSPDGLLLAACGEDGGVRLWDVASGRINGEVSRQIGTRALAISQRTKILALGAGRTVHLWERETGAIIRRLATRDNVVFVAFAYEGKVLVAGTQSGEVRAWSTRTWEYHDQMSRPDPVPGSGAAGFAIGNDGRCLAVGSDNGTVGIWYPHRPDD